MLKKRIIPVLLLKNNRMVKGKQFQNHIDTGNPSSTVKIYTSQYADELMFIDIEATLGSRKALIETIKNSAKYSLMPFTVGGGIKTIEDIRELLISGADKVLITSSACENPDFISKAVKVFGSQAIVAGIDYKFNKEIKKNFVWTKCGTIKTNIDPVELSKKLRSINVGEIMLNSIDRDGMMDGYDLSLSKKISENLDIPVIACGGAGNFQHLVELFKKTDVSGAACASIFHFGDNCPLQARTYLRNHGIEMRNIK